LLGLWRTKGFWREKENPLVATTALGGTAKAHSAPNFCSQIFLLNFLSQKKKEKEIGLGLFAFF
jgi:hypothetical protein